LDNKRIAIGAVKLGAIGLVALALSEVFSPTVYKDIVGVDTYGYGETEIPHKGATITPERALLHLLKRVEDDYGNGVKNCVKVPLYQYEYDAYVNLAYNVGVGAFCKKADKNRKNKITGLPDPEPDRLIDVLNAGKYEEACERIKGFNKAGGRVVKGLTIRREREYQMCIGN
jgi:lysozyme